MTRFFATLLVLLAQVFAMAAPGRVVRCVREDGREALELAGSECCRAAHEVERAWRCCDEHAQGPSVRAAAGRCRDVPLEPTQTLVSRARARVEPAAADRSAPVAIVACPAESHGIAFHPARARRCEALRGTVPRHRRAIVLRC